MGIWDWKSRNIRNFIKRYSPTWNSLADFELVVSMSLVPGKKTFFLSAYCVLYCFFAFSIEVRYSFCLCSHTKKMYVLNFHEILSEQLPVLSVSYTYALWQEFLNFCPKILNVCDFFNMFQIKWLKNYNQEQGLKNMKNFILQSRKKKSLLKLVKSYWWKSLWKNWKIQQMLPYFTIGLFYSKDAKYYPTSNK